MDQIQQTLCPPVRFHFFEAFGFAKQSPYLELMNFAVEFVVAEDIRLFRYGIRKLRANLISSPQFQTGIQAITVQSIFLALIVIFSGIGLGFFVFLLELFFFSKKYLVVLKLRF